MSQKLNKDVLTFARGYCAVTGEDVNKVYDKLMQARKTHKETGTEEYNQELLNRWKDSGRTDYSVYDDPDYISEGWLSYEMYSKQYIKKIATKLKEIKAMVGDIDTFVDLGAGIGYSTLMLKNLFPESQMIATQMKDTWQWTFCEKLFETTGIELKENQELTSADAIFASEYFEHFDNPIHHLNELLALNPKLLFIKSTFQKPNAVGHFEFYYDEKGRMVEGGKMNRYFNKYLRDKGYVQNPVRFFNSAPTVFVKK